MLSYHPTAKTTVSIRKEIKENKDNLTIKEQAKKYKSFWKQYRNGEIEIILKMQKL